MTKILKFLAKKYPAPRASGCEATSGCEAKKSLGILEFPSKNSNFYAKIKEKI